MARQLAPAAGLSSFLDPPEDRMSQKDLYSALSRATGESVRTLKGRGFSLLDHDMRQLDSESVDMPPRTVDWDDVEVQRLALVIQA
jgi:hypothetical protein